MADDKQSGPGLGGNSIIILLAAAASAIYMGWRNPPLLGTGPTGPDYEISQTRSAQDVDARLWQDPFTAVTRGIEDKRNAKIDPDDGHRVTDFLKSLESGEKPRETLLIGVALPGDPYREAVETRRRLRYAVLSALHVAKYVPFDGKHIGYFLTSEKPARRPPAMGVFGERVFEAAAAEDNELSVPAIVPFEKYEALDGKKRVIVLWLDEVILAHRQNPIASLAGLLCKLDLDEHDNESFVFLGPQDSDVLQRMVQEVKGDKDPVLKQNCPLPEGEPSVSASVSTNAQSHEAAKVQQHKPLAGDLPVYNFGVTAEDRIILRHAGVNPEKTDIKSLFLAGNVAYYRTISSDEELAEVLAQELSRHGIDLCPREIWRDGVPPSGSRCLRLHHDRVFLLTEWDTPYGRYLPESVSATFGADDSSFGGCRLSTSHGIMHASYLRGLNGRLPSRRAAGEAQPYGRQNGGQTSGERGEQTAGGEPSATPQTLSRFESAEGDSQFDYLSRLTEALKECDEKLRHEGAGRIAAIGVLGSDVYDKLLLLQAMGPQFPWATFFTTDLDALLLAQGRIRYARNLLVASGYGLTLIPELQRDVLPFRGSFQTSIFLATFLAIRNSSLSAPNTHAKSDPWPDTTAALGCWLKKPLLFEIGRNIARGLPTDPVGGADEACKARYDRATADFLKYASIHPSVAKLYPEFTFATRVGMFLVPIALFGALLSFPEMRRVCLSRLAPREAEIGLASASDRTQGPPRFVQPGLVWGLLLVLTTLAIWAVVILGWQRTAPWLTEYGKGEPIDLMTLLEGISNWPTIALRVFGIILSLFFIWYTLRALEINRYDTAEEMGIEAETPSALCEVVKYLRKQARWTDRVVSLFWLAPKSTYDNSLGFDIAGRQKIKFRDIVGFPPKWQIRCARAAAATYCVLLVWILILHPVFGPIFDLPLAGRGLRVSAIYAMVSTMDFLCTLFLTFLVADAMLYSRAFIVRLTQVSTVWPDSTADKFDQRFGLRGEAIADWIDMQYLARSTRCITGLIYFPFLSFAVMILARGQLFDNFPTLWIIPIAQASSLVAIVGSVLAYRSAAEAARKAAREHLTARIIATQGDAKTAGQLERMLNETESLTEGAFAPWTSQPIVRAVLLPLVTYVATWLAHIYGLPGT